MVESQPSKLSRLASVSEAELAGEIPRNEGPQSGWQQWESGSNSVVESQPSKLLVAGSIPVSRSSYSVTRTTPPCGLFQ